MQGTPPIPSRRLTWDTCSLTASGGGTNGTGLPGFTSTPQNDILPSFASALSKCNPAHHRKTFILSMDRFHAAPPCSTPLVTSPPVAVCRAATGWESQPRRKPRSARRPLPYLVEAMQLFCRRLSTMWAGGPSSCMHVVPACRPTPRCRGRRQRLRSRFHSPLPGPTQLPTPPTAIVQFLLHSNPCHQL